MWNCSHFAILLKNSYDLQTFQATTISRLSSLNFFPPLHLYNTYSVIYVYLARAKSKALDIIYSLLKQNIESCNAKRRRQRERLKKTTIGLISKKATLPVQAQFFWHVSLPLFCTTSTWFLVTRFMEEM